MNRLEAADTFLHSIKRSSRCGKITIALLLVLFVLLLVQRSFALGEPQYVENVFSPGSFCVAQGNTVAPVYVDRNDFAGVLIAANSFRADVNRVTRHTPALVYTGADLGTNAIIIGTIGKSRLIEQLIHDGKIDVSSIEGKWESYFTQVVPNPLPGVAHGLVIVGSDKRGTIYGIYDLSAEMGVSPWYWWADVPVPHHNAVFVKAGKYEQGPPAVKYRGIFLNDEWPDLTEWVKQRYGNYNHAFYTNVFELLLRLKANYLWPAMWDNCFSEDDPLNPKLANEYGIVMGTSHVEPMMRADKEWNRLGCTAKEWNYLTHSNLLDAFWKVGLERNKDYENIITIAMRGKIDTPMSPTANISLLEEIVAAQRKIISQVYQTNAADVPQLWALYKEVQEYYEKGMRVPGDVTLLWCDDNWGDIRRLPSPASWHRRGGAGVYYHFDYVGGPRNYKWVNTNPTTKIWEQMNLAYQYHARRIWIVNVGHLKGYELPIQFFMNLAWDPQRWPKEKISEFTRQWAEQQFGPEYAGQIADILSKYTKYNGRRKPELLSPDTYNLVDYREAHRVLADWKAITAEAEEIYKKLPENERDAFFELVLYPTKACEQVNDLYITTAKNRLYAAQGRASANDYAAQARALFKADADLSYYYNHVLAGGKWEHMMDQTHIGYTYWQQPPTNVMPQEEEIQVPVRAALGVAVQGSTSAWPGAISEPTLPAFDVFNRPREYIDVFNRGKTPFEFSATPSAPWIELSATNGTIAKQQRLWVSVDWSRVPKGNAHGSVTITGAGAEPVVVSVSEFNPKQPTRSSLKGFVEADGYVSIEAVHYTKKIDTAAARWEEIPNLGRTLSAMSIFPVTASSATPPENSPCLEYRMYLFHPGEVEVEAIIDPTLNFVQGRGLCYALSFDDQPPRIVTAVPADYSAMDGNHDWETTVKNSVRKVITDFTLSHTGYHTLKFWMVDPGVVLQKLVVNLGRVKPSYLGPPESYHSGTNGGRAARALMSTQSADSNLPVPKHWTSEQDHQNMMEQLGIKKLRPGADGWHPNSPNYQNTDEAKANPYPNLPDPLRLNDGKEVTTPEMWWKERRPQIVEAFEKDVDGRVPKNVPKVTWKVVSIAHTNNGAIPVITKKLVGHVDNSSYPLVTVNIPLTLTTPADATGPVPVMLHFGFDWSRFFHGTNASRVIARLNHPNWEQLVLSNGWAYAVTIPTDYQADNGAGLTRGIIGLCNQGQPRKPDQWGALRAWAWGASRALDYFETDPAVNAKEVGIEGLSRFGKAALVTMAFDQRFAIGLIGSSGKGGAALFRRNFGERVSNLTGTGEYHWMAGNFLKYGGPLTPGDLPVDSHELIALCAPRPVFISYGATSGTPHAEGPWVDQHGSFMAAVAAGPVYRLLGKQGLDVRGNYLTAKMPPLNTALTSGDIAWRQHDGGHTDAPNWPAFLKWADRYIHAPPLAKSPQAK